jgi:hypothetical protein
MSPEATSNAANNVVVPCRLYSWAKPRERPSVGQPEPALRSLEGLDPGLLVDAQDERVLGWVEIEPDDVGGLLGERGVRAQAPAPAPAQADPMAAEGPPDRVGRDVPEPLGNERPCPRGVPLGRWFIEGREDALGGLFAIAGMGPRSGRVDEPGQSITGETRPPLAHPGRPGLQLSGDHVGPDAVGGSEDDPGALDHPLLAPPGPPPGSKRLLLSFRQHDGGGGLPRPGSLDHAALFRH